MRVEAIEGNNRGSECDEVKETTTGEQMGQMSREVEVRDYMSGESSKGTNLTT